MVKNAIRLKGFEIALLNLGCGTQKNGIGIDMLDFGQDIVWDLRKGIPLPNDCVKEFFTSHFLEHIARHDMYELFNEIMRVAVPDATLYAIVPHAETVEADFLGHFSYWDERRVNGVIMGLRGALELMEMKRDGIELRFRLRIKK